MAKTGKTRLKILQVSDCHVSAKPDANYRGQSADRNLLNLLSVMRSWGPDLILLTGDVSEDASPAAYARVAIRLGTIGAPILALPGNHDRPEVMKDHFARGPWKRPYVMEKSGWMMVMLDSTKPGKISGSLSQHALEQLDELLRTSGADHLLIALHHQPVPVNAPWIDRYALEDPEMFFRLVDRDPRVRCVLWGHVHQDFRAVRKEVHLLGGPSTVANSLPGTPKFSLDLEGPSCRWLELGADGAVETGVLRADQSSAGRTSQRIR